MLRKSPYLLENYAIFKDQRLDQVEQQSNNLFGCNQDGIMLQRSPFAEQQWDFSIFQQGKATPKPNKIANLVQESIFDKTAKILSQGIREINQACLLYTSPSPRDS
eukprot:TRINITY_DN11536_c0_g2_i1.p2 TRINITY_DN11536_c0_g2~~TRINITY_DN11536_c0_g2_i1.p2  ORF type:complete len:106 (+),score=16.48 TRINITY_DN11536_c0_g2_i1:141-458(+)